MYTIASVRVASRGGGSDSCVYTIASVRVASRGGGALSNGVSSWYVGVSQGRAVSLVLLTVCEMFPVTQVYPPSLPLFPLSLCSLSPSVPSLPLFPLSLCSLSPSVPSLPLFPL